MMTFDEVFKKYHTLIEEQIKRHEEETKTLMEQFTRELLRAKSGLPPLPWEQPPPSPPPKQPPQPWQQKPPVT